jgi:hypothetical protein
MICTKCDPAGHVAGEEREYLTRAYAELLEQVKEQSVLLRQIANGERPPDRFLGDRIAATQRDMAAIQNLQIVVGMVGASYEHQTGA